MSRPGARVAEPGGSRQDQAGGMCQPSVLGRYHVRIGATSPWGGGNSLVGVYSRGVSQLAGGEPPEASGQLLLGLALPILWGQTGVCLDTSRPTVAVEGGPISGTSWGSLPLDAVRAVKGGTWSKTGPS